MAAEDQRVRAAPGDRAFARRITLQQRMAFARIDVANTDRLREIVVAYGWPGRALVGEEGADHAWLIAQHADHQLDSQRLFLRELRTAVEASDAPPRHLAYLTDRVAMNEGRPQRFGTQVGDMHNGVAIPWPIDAPDGVDERRAAMGLPPLGEHLGQWQGMT